MPDLVISQPEWDAIDPGARDQIKRILVDCKLLDDSDNIRYDPFVAAAAFTVPNSVCKAACVAAEAVALGACAMLPSPTEIIACTAAARAAGELCKSACAARDQGNARVP